MCPKCRAGLTVWWALRTSQRLGPTRKRGAEGAEKIETRKASRGGRPSRLGGLGERRKLPQRHPGRSPAAENGLLVKFELEKYI